MLVHTLHIFEPLMNFSSSSEGGMSSTDSIALSTHPLHRFLHALQSRHGVFKEDERMMQLKVAR